MKVIFITVFICIGAIATAQSVKAPVSSSFELLNSYSAVHNDVFSFTHNTAALARQRNFAAGVYGENRFSLPESNLFSGVINLSTANSNFGVSADYFGFRNFNEYELGLAYARPAGDNLDIGARFNYYSYQIPAYHHASTVTFQVGAIARLSGQLNVGIEIYNPVGGYLSKINNEKLASVYQFGIGYEPSESIIVSGTMVKEEGKNVNVVAGVFYQFDRRFFARGGIQTGTNSPFAAAGIAFNDFRTDLSVSYHPQLGYSPGLMFIYNPVSIKK